MIKLNKLLEGVDLIAVKGERNIEIDNIYYDSKQLRPGGMFFAIRGTKLNGLNFADEAIERGAVCVVSEEDFISYKNITKVLVKDARKVCAVVAGNFYESPSEKIKVVGITGTNGKTTTLYLIEAILKQTGKDCATIGTISYNVGERRIPATNTTPSSIMLQMLLREMLKLGIPYCAMEVSSHSLHQSRVDGIRYRSAIFTNLTGEHLDYHKDMEEYFMAKKRLFEMLGNDAIAITNADDDYGRRIIDTTKAGVFTYGIKNAADIRALDIRTTLLGSLFKIETPKGTLQIKTTLIGEHNIYNILSAVSFALSEEIDLKEIEDGLRNFKNVPGRLQSVDCGQNFSVFVDYAHTDDALRKVLSTLRKLAKKRIIVAFGCGGDRDKTKRPRMGNVAAELADYLIITSDNPRSEDPKAIADDIVKGLPAGFKNYTVSIDRQKAIEISLEMAGEGDIVLIAGKGHEAYQIFKDTVISFDDRKVVESILNGTPLEIKEASEVV